LLYSRPTEKVIKLKLDVDAKFEQSQCRGLLVEASGSTAKAFTRGAAFGMTLEEAQTVVSPISDSDIENKDQIEEGDAVEHADKDRETEDENNDNVRLAEREQYRIIDFKSVPLKQKNQLQQINRSSYNSLITKDKKVVAVRWYDKKVVNMASNFIGTEPQDEVRRWNKKRRILRNSKPSWLEYQYNMVSSGQQFHMNLLQFTMTVLESFAFFNYSVSTLRRGRPLSATSSSRFSPVPMKRQKPNTGLVDDVRFDNIGHWPIHRGGHEQRCKLQSCAGRSRMQCEKYSVLLCQKFNRKLNKCY
ncbi:hypothetical protein ILUMI_09730, partial [Ignelater luminosus]